MCLETGNRVRKQRTDLYTLYTNSSALLGVTTDWLTKIRLSLLAAGHNGNFSRAGGLLNQTARLRSMAVYATPAVSIKRLNCSHLAH